MDNQYTIAEPITFSGIGLHTGVFVTVELRPAHPNSGIRFFRTDIEPAVEIPADVDFVVSTARCTTLGKNGVTLQTVEHLLGTTYGMGIDNLDIMVQGPEIPILDGSALAFAEKIAATGLVMQDAPRATFRIPSHLRIEDAERGATLNVWPSADFQAEVTIDFNSEAVVTQSAYHHDAASFATSIAPARTFVFLHELEYLVKNELIRGGNLDNALVFVDQVPAPEKQAELAALFQVDNVKVNGSKLLNEASLRFPNEPARHKLLDVMGDLALSGVFIQGHVQGFRPGHALNTALAKKIKQLVREEKAGKTMPAIDLTRTLYNIHDIMRMLPHRYPFLLIDRVVEMSEQHVVGIKNVTMNEPFFQGHFPGNPVMPGVLQIEAMAQVGGILVMANMDEPEKYTPYFIKIESVKFKQKVQPGDTLVFWLHLKSPIRRGICHMEGRAFVDGKLVMEGEMMAQIVRNEA
jgi:UDP-3-O-[3-hydroxymyristoyl] N-acetylglucosamine deacetylase/3-hydroxyacyl-[acyl-carrier-protein] dehydratase